jgi:hypothetical protein
LLACQQALLLHPARNSSRLNASQRPINRSDNKRHISSQQEHGDSAQPPQYTLKTRIGRSDTELHPLANDANQEC